MYIQTDFPSHRVGPFNPTIIDDQSLLVLKYGAGRQAWNNEREEYQALFECVMFSGKRKKGGNNNNK
jgi:hypothetical protein